MCTISTEDTDVSLDLAPSAQPATGSVATEVAIRTTNMVRVKFINPARCRNIKRGF